MKLQLSDTAVKDLKKLNPITQKQIVKKLKFFLSQPEPVKYAVKLTGITKGGDYRFRVGNYRVVFELKGGAIYILYIEHRRDVYRR